MADMTRDEAVRAAIRLGPSRLPRRKVVSHKVTLVVNSDRGGQRRDFTDKLECGHEFHGLATASSKDAAYHGCLECAIAGFERGA